MHPHTHTGSISANALLLPPNPLQSPVTVTPLLVLIRGEDTEGEIGEEFREKKAEEQIRQRRGVGKSRERRIAKGRRK